MNETNTTQAVKARAEFLAAVTGGEADPQKWRTAQVGRLLKKLALNWTPDFDPDPAETQRAMTETVLLMARLERAVRKALAAEVRSTVPSELHPLLDHHRAVAEHVESYQV